MKFIAILRDSVREALDYKVIYFLFGLSGLVILLAASVSYRPEPAEEGLQAIVKRLPGGEQAFGPSGPLAYEVENFQQVNEPRPVWEGEFRYTLMVREQERGLPEDFDDEGNGEAKKKKKGPKFSTLRLLVLVDLLKKKPGQWTDEDRRVLVKIQRLDKETTQKVEEMTKKAGPGGEVHPAALRHLLTEAFKEGTTYITEGQITRFLQTRLAASGTLDVTELKLAEEKDRTFRFAVEAKARPETVRTWPHTPYLFFGAVKVPFTTGVAPWVLTLETWIVTG